MLDGLRRCLGGRGSYASPKHHDKGTPASRQMNNLLPENVSCYQYLSSGNGTSYNLIVLIVGDLSMGVTNCYIYRFEGHELQSEFRYYRLTQ